MAQQSNGGWDRREILGGAALLAMVVGVPAATVSVLRSEDEPPSVRQRRLIADVSQRVIPRSDTAGAGDVGVGDFVILALAHGLDGTRDPAGAFAMPVLARYKRSDGSLRYLDWLSDELDERGRSDFLARTRSEREAILSKLDAEAFAADGDHPWKTIKSLILTGYYTSEVGGSKELRYVLVPGRWNPDIPMKPDARAFSSNWTAVDFG